MALRFLLESTLKTGYNSMSRIKPKLGFRVVPSNNHSLLKKAPSSCSSRNFCTDLRVLDPPDGDSKPELNLDWIDPKVFPCYWGGGEGWLNLTCPKALTPARKAAKLYNKQQNAQLEFVRVLKATEQHVWGRNFNLTLVAMDVGVEKTYEALVIHYFPHNKKKCVWELESFQLVPDKSET